ncbi:hypothetical protein T484DRAFT_1940188 [Baffinella frigidus]|nr:hypothetical protein T484DRAFT_1940188 [Cryptophyta sp. CCMP2293]
MTTSLLITVIRHQWLSPTEGGRHPRRERGQTLRPGCRGLRLWISQLQSKSEPKLDRDPYS